SPPPWPRLTAPTSLRTATSSPTARPSRSPPTPSPGASTWARTSGWYENPRPLHVPRALGTVLVGVLPLPHRPRQRAVPLQDHALHRPRGAVPAGGGTLRA